MLCDSFVLIWVCLVLFTFYVCFYMGMGFNQRVCIGAKNSEPEILFIKFRLLKKIPIISLMARACSIPDQKSLQIKAYNKRVSARRRKAGCLEIKAWSSLHQRKVLGCCRVVSKYIRSWKIHFRASTQWNLVGMTQKMESATSLGVTRQGQAMWVVCSHYCQGAQWVCHTQCNLKVWRRKV